MNTLMSNNLRFEATCKGQGESQRTSKIGLQRPDRMTIISLIGSFFPVPSAIEIPHFSL